MGRYQYWKQKRISRDWKEWAMKRFEAEMGPRIISNNVNYI
jgi:hypothetical protein